MSRNLTANERALLEWLLDDPQIPDADALRAQIPVTTVTAGTPNLPSYLHLSLTGASPAECPDGPAGRGAVVENAAGEPTGGLILWVQHGYLASVEHWWVTDAMPEEFPSVEQLRRWRPDEILSGKAAPSN